MAAGPLPGSSHGRTEVVSTRDYGTMVYLLDGRVLDPRARERFLEGWSALLDETSERRFAERAANTANVSVCGIDPSLASERRRISSRDQMGPADALLDDPLELLHERSVGTREALRLTAHATGGEAHLYHGPKIEEALRRVEEDSSRFYLLTYATPAPRGDGRFHEGSIARLPHVVLHCGVDCGRLHGPLIPIRRGWPVGVRCPSTITICARAPRMSP